MRPNFDELLEAARTRPLLSEALKQLGVELKPVGHGRGGARRWQTTTKPGHSGDLSSVVFMEEPDGGWVVFDNKERSGKNTLDALGVLTNLFAVPFRDAVYMLSGGSPSLPPRSIPPARSAPPPMPEAVFKQPERAESDRHVFAYLTKERLIPAAVVSDLLRLGAVYESAIDTANGKRMPAAVFPIKNEKEEIVGADCCGTYSDLRFKHIAEGSDPRYAWRFTNRVKEGASDTRLFFCESAIDAISLYCLTGAQGIYLSMAGVKDATFLNMSAVLNGTPVICTDNDDAGNRFCGKHPSCETLRPEIGKDWNDELKYRVARNLDYALKTQPPPVKAARV